MWSGEDIGWVTNVSTEAELATMGNGKARQEQQPAKTHQASGYTWSRPEDEPGYAWLNKKAVDEAARAWDGLLHKDFAVKGMFSCGRIPGSQG